MFNQVVRLAAYFHVGTSIILLGASIVQACAFILLARGLGVDTFGQLMVLQAATQLITEIVSLGAGEALIRRVVRDASQHNAAFGHALLMSMLSAVVLGACVTLWINHVQHSIPFIAILVFVYGELLGNRFGALSEQIFIAHLQVGSANGIRVLAASLKLSAVVAGIYGLGASSLPAWMLVQGTATFLTGSACIAIVGLRLGAPSIAFHRDDLGFGTLMVGTQLSRAIQFTADRIVLAMVAPPFTVGVYSAAIRGVQFSLIPIQAILRNLFPQFFSVGREGIVATRALVISLLPKVLTIGVFSAIVLFFGANIFAYVLGPGFAGAATVLRWLACVALLQGIQYFLADALTGADWQSWRTTLAVLGAIGYVIIIAGFTKLWSIGGLIMGIYIYQIAMIVAYIVVINVLASARNSAETRSVSSTS
jgi:O-antigen/teichoic acid export membrane protein